MNRLPVFVLTASSFVGTVAASLEAFAQDAPPTEAPPTEAPPTEAAPPAPPPAAATPPDAAAGEPKDGGRFRFGINGTAGVESVSGDGGVSLSGAMYGLDVRLGYQLSHLLAIYAQPHLSFGSLSVDGGGSSLSGGTGTFVGTVLGEVTFIDRIFVGAGFGYGVLNNPSGLTIEARAGAYPLMGHGANGIRRRGLMIGLDFRSIFTDVGTGTLIMGALGYDAF